MANDPADETANDPADSLRGEVPNNADRINANQDNSDRSGFAAQANRPSATSASAIVAPASTTQLPPASVPLDDLSVPAAGAASTAPLTATEQPAGDPVTIYRQALAQLTDMTADMAANFESIQWVDGKMVVTLVDAYNTTMCCKPDRKSKIESAVGDVAGRVIRVDFIASKKRPAAAKTTQPKLSRVQQIRKLQEHDFVKEAVDLFDCEISDFYQE